MVSKVLCDQASFDVVEGNVWLQNFLPHGQLGRAGSRVRRPPASERKQVTRWIYQMDEEATRAHLVTYAQQGNVLAWDSVEASDFNWQRV